MISFIDSLRSVRSLLCVGAHADDIEIGCGATVLTLLAEVPKLEVFWVVLTGSPERHAEARTGAQSFGGANVVSLDLRTFRERYLPYDEAVKEFFDELGARVDPDLVLSPWEGDAHQDHSTVASLVLNTFRDHLILQYEIPKYDGDLGRPTVYVPIDRSVAEMKVSLLFECFPSQVSRYWFTEETFSGLMRMRGIECKAESGLAEAFHSKKLVLA